MKHIAATVSWTVIAAAVALLVVLQATREKGGGADEVGAPLELTGRYVVGVHVVLSAGSTEAARVQETVQRAAKTKSEKVAAMIVGGELGQDEKAEWEKFAKAYVDGAAGQPWARDVAALKAIYGGAYATETGAEWMSAKEAGDWLKTRYGWFGELAATHGMAETTPERAAVLWPAKRMVLVAGGVFVAAMIFGVAGLGLFILLAVLLGTRRMRLNYAPVDTRSALLEAFALYLGVFAAVSLTLRWSSISIPLWGSGVVTLLMPLTLLWPRVRGISWQALGAALGVSRGKGIVREIGAGAIGYVAGMPVFAVGVAITLVLTKISGVDASHPIIKALHGGGGGTIVLLYLLAAVWAPITEELLFRGAFFGHLRQQWGWVGSALLVSLIFAGIHPQGWAAIPALGSLALVFAGIREWRGSIIGCMTAHAINNGVVLTVVLLMLR